MSLKILLENAKKEFEKMKAKIDQLNQKDGEDWTPQDDLNYKVWIEQLEALENFVTNKYIQKA